MKWWSHLHRALLIFFLLHYVVRFFIICTLHGSEAIPLSLRAFSSWSSSIIRLLARVLPLVASFVFVPLCNLYANWYKSVNEGQ